MQKFYITTSIPYVNSAPHLGNVLDSLYADVLARFWRQRHYDVRFLTGTDEHGAKIVRTAEAAGLTPQQLVDQNSAKFRALKEALNLSWDDFIRTSDQVRHWPGAQKMWLALSAKGDLYKKTYKGLYCVGHEAFVTEKDLIGGVCRDHQKNPEVIEEENWFFRLSKYSKEIELKIKNDELKIVPESRKNEILALLENGLEDVSFSRPRQDLSWGIPVPNDDTQTIYVWADALVNYISALGYGGDRAIDNATFKKYWPADVQIIGKDNLRFHAAIWPGMLLSAGLELPKTIFVHGFLNISGQKISKTVGNVIDPVELAEKYGTDPVRYYLLREITPFEDGDFSYEKFHDRYNADLANGLGNFASRVLTLASKLGEFSADLKNANPEITKKIESVTAELDRKVKDFKFHEALAVVGELISFGDGYVNEKKPWKNPDPKVIFDLVLILDNTAALLRPFLPATSEKITASINWVSKDALKIKKSEVLFPRFLV
ncbi:MAG: methionine--tRNA ligase [Patescibacteria group bacterium]